MKAWSWQHYGTFDGLQPVQRPVPVPGPGEVLMRIRANSLNQRDLMAARGALPRKGRPDIVPLCDGAGEIVAIGEGVSQAAVGDRVIATYFPQWIDGPLQPAHTGQTLGSDVDGLLREYAVLPKTGLLRIPAHLDFAEAATLPCAAVTAWSALFVKGALQAGETMLTLGSGGVSLFAIQLAKASGARVIVTTSNPERGERLRALGADVVIDYRNDDWPQQVRALGGADVIVENGGGGTYVKSLGAAAWHARVAIVGLITGFHDPGGSLMPILMNDLTIRAVQVGSRADTAALLAFMESHGLRPVIDSRHSFDKPRTAYERLASGEAFGKVVIEYG
ncbi:NAD(P)-dependent alcohol dehydrogenase [Solimonas terrae]|uniref:NAD(P)-dependent alcohol dehydrogenase n=2 Tax=Solimonas terrae TaxID=1396819 RepID=A0A6M2BPM3_9GAMM|nr:NAD(P)-dependent alcohol dehydrogenase [Solimonas terrae]